MGFKNSVANKLDRLLGSLRTRREEESKSRLDPSKLSEEELREADHLMRVARGLPRLNPIERAEREAQEAGQLSFVVPREQMREDARQMERADFDPDRLSPDEQERLGALFEKMAPDA